MVRELKAALPSAQHDYSRLNALTTIGEDLSRMWNKEDMLIVFESMQASSRWLQVLHSFKINVDIRTALSFHLPTKESYMRSLVQQLLVQSNMDLGLTSEYCRQFNLESGLASMTYLEQSLLAPVCSGRVDSAWRANIKAVASGTNESSVIAMLKSHLKKIHPLDYERISFVCLWLIELLTEDTVHLDGTLATMTIETDTYHRYLDVLHILENLNLPYKVIFGINATLTILPLTEGSNLKIEYSCRVPLWQLLHDPLGLLGKIVEVSPEHTSKLLPICDILQVLH